VSLAHELLNHIEPEIESISLIPSDGSRFEVSVNNTLLYSKLQTGRHANPGEVLGLVSEYLSKK
jgi:selenoprotein W-related protein